MPAVRINMRKLKDALRLKFEGGLSHQQIATALGISKGVVTKYVGLAVAARLDWQAIAAMDEASLERRLLPAPRPSDIYAPADYGRIHQELRRKGMTLALLWEEYCAETADLFSAEEIDLLATELGLQTAITGDSLAARAASLVEIARQHNLSFRLRQLVQRERPNAFAS